MENDVEITGVGEGVNLKPNATKKNGYALQSENKNDINGNTGNYSDSSNNTSDNLKYVESTGVSVAESTGVPDA